jgi:hypothetical protein
MERKAYSFPESAKVCGVSPYTLRRLADQKCIKSINIAGRRLIPADELDRILREGAGKRRSRKASADRNDGKQPGERAHIPSSSKRDCRPHRNREVNEP